MEKVRCTLKYQLHSIVIDNIKKSLHLPEMGGILGLDENCTVTRFHYDSTGTTTETHYIPDVVKLNKVIQDWATEGIAFAGFVHSHPKNAQTLSSCDVDYAKKIKSRCSLNEILMLIYIPEEEKLLQYVI